MYRPGTVQPLPLKAQLTELAEREGVITTTRGTVATSTAVVVIVTCASPLVVMLLT